MFLDRNNNKINVGDIIFYADLWGEQRLYKIIDSKGHNGEPRMMNKRGWVFEGFNQNIITKVFGLKAVCLRIYFFFWVGITRLKEKLYKL